MMRWGIDDQEAGMDPHRLGFPDRSSRLRVLRVDQAVGMVDMSPSELRTSDVRVVRLDQVEGRVPPREGSLQMEDTRSSEKPDRKQFKRGIEEVMCKRIFDEKLKLATYPEMRRFWIWLRLDSPDGRPPIKPGSFATDRDVSWIKIDQLGGMLPVTPDSEFTFKLCRLVRSAQLVGRVPVTARCETSSVTSVVIVDHAEGSCPVTPVSPLTLR